MEPIGPGRSAPLARPDEYHVDRYSEFLAAREGEQTHALQQLHRQLRRWFDVGWRRHPALI
ncbi:hypothetical protein [Nonomuraea antimicrobica]|uniref:hypothetical protein n=1 Tax=Nonomuraea antimicrobica TaxID=561173 RepID=UPI0031EFA829